MNLYIIENVLWEYTPGMVCIVAENLDQARSLFSGQFSEYEIRDYDQAIQTSSYEVLKVVDETPRIVSYVYGGA